LIGHLAKLNPEQRAVVDARGHCLAIACPGSGKTSTAASKAAVLLGEDRRVTAVTFTKDAALELRERIVKIAGEEASPRLLVGTFHSICLLMAFPSRARSQFGREILMDMRSPFSEEWDLVKTGVQFQFVQRSLKENGINMKVQDALFVIEAAKESDSLDHLDDETRGLVETYQDIMQRSGKIDFQDIILKTNKAMRDGTLTPLAVNDMLVDEFQDTDKAQFEWIGHHALAGTNLTAVGDDDQSIYGFRRALGYEGMDRLTKEFGADRILLGTNYRCRSEILGAAQHLINHNTERIEKRLFAHKGEGGVVAWETFKDVATESAAVAEEAAQALGEGAEFAVIAHTNRELIDIQRALMMRDIPFRKSDGKSLFDYVEVQTFGAVLRALIKVSANDIDMALAWTGMSEGDSREIRRLFGSSIRIGSPKDFEGSDVSEAGVKTWRNFAKKYNEWASLLQQGFNSLLHMGVHEWLLETIQKPNSDYVLQTAADLFDPKQKNLAKHLSDLRSAEQKAKQEERAAVETGEQRKNVVWLLTAHGSKGLEFDRVWIVGVQHGAFPSEKSSLEEERRLMFVAMTRAKEMLWVSATKDKKPSVFAYESRLLEAPKRGAKS
jgi:DNA helicase II / ATP-dependent DNA helicase PcrA